MRRTYKKLREIKIKNLKCTKYFIIIINEMYGKISLVLFINYSHADEFRDTKNTMDLNLKPDFILFFLLKFQLHFFYKTD